MKRYILAMLIVILLASHGLCQEGKEVSIYGEIKSVNNAGNSMTVGYYDDKDNIQKAITIEKNDNTRVEWEVGLEGIKQGYWADIDYVVVNGKNIAKLIIVEKEDNPDTGQSEPESAED